jgi:hypothetical protein
MDAAWTLALTIAVCRRLRASIWRLQLNADTLARPDPILHHQALEALEIRRIGRDKRKSAGNCDRRDLTVDKRRCPPVAFEACTLLAVPLRRAFVIRQNR